jgi:hypothetical protein
MLQRFRIEARGMIPNDLLNWALGVFTATSVTAKRELRNALLRDAAAMVGGSTWARARRIHAEMLRTGPSLDEVGKMVNEAMAFVPGKRVMTLRNLLTILQ